jgi:uncharacterized Fe-S cluster protein YjdI/CDGSH-type Zn-finger protein
MARRDYSTDEIVVHWNSERCIHSGVCLGSLPEVFDLDTRPWVTVDGASADAIADTIHRCPSGALSYERLGDAPGEQFSDRTSIIPWPNGPLTIRGSVRLWTVDGRVIAEEGRMALCRCGASDNQPFCDNSHRRVQFSDSERLIAADRRDAESPEGVHRGPGIDPAD